MDGLRPFADPHPQLPVVDLGLLARRGLAAHRGQLRPFALGPIRLEKALHLLIAAGKAEPRQLPVQHHAVPAHFRPALFDEFDETIDWPWLPLMATRLPGAEPEPTFDRLAIYPEFARHPLDALAALRTCQYLPHRIRA